MEPTDHPIIDPHVHILPPRRMRGLIRWLKKFAPSFVEEDLTAEEALQGLADADIGTFFNLVFPLWEEETAELNLWNRDFCRGVPGAIPFGSVHIETPDKAAETERCIVQYGFAGMKLHPYAQRFDAFALEMRGLYEVLDHYGKPLLVHTGYDVFYGQEQDRSAMEETFRRYPRIPVVLVHSLFPEFELASRWLQEFPQLYLDMTNVFSSLRVFKQGAYSGVLVEAEEFPADLQMIEDNYPAFLRLFEEFPNRIIYGSDYPVGMGRHEQLYEDLTFFELPPETERRLLFTNARRLLAETGYPG